MADRKYGNMTLGHAIRMAEDPETRDLLTKMGRRVKMVEPEMAVFREWCYRADKLFYAEHFTDGGADLWWDDPSAKTAGRSHVSVNTPGPIVEIPAALQSVEPVENFLATDTTPESRLAASALERVYVAWKYEEDYELKFHKTATVKGLYGRAAVRVVWEDSDEPGEKGHPEVQVIDQPQNLYLGWKSDQYDSLEWAAYVMRMSPESVMETYGVDVQPVAEEGSKGRYLPQVVPPTQNPYETDNSAAATARPWLDYGEAMIEVWDYWYRQPRYGKNGKILGFDTYNVVVCGNYVLRKPTKYPYYAGKLPYVVVFNTYVPGLPTGRADLHDAEQLIREKYEKITAGSQMIANAVAGDYWQLTGENAPWRVPAGLKPKRNELISAGPGNRIEVIQPFIAQFQLEQYLGRIDRELSVITGLNDLLFGLAPAQVLSSSKAINALVANYESRLSMRRKLFYKFRREIWELALQIWVKKDPTIKTVYDAGGGRLDITDPSLNPRDDMETAQRALQLVTGKLISQRTGMDWIGIDDPETEQDLIREESTDAALWPERVQVMAQLMSALQSLGIQTPPAAQQQAQGQMASSQATLAAALQGQTPTVDQGAGGPGAEPPPTAPPIPGADAGNGGGAFAQAQNPQQPALMQSMIQSGKVKGRILTQQKLGNR